MISPVKSRKRDSMRIFDAMVAHSSEPSLYVETFNDSEELYREDRKSESFATSRIVFRRSNDRKNSRRGISEITRGRQQPYTVASYRNTQPRHTRTHSLRSARNTHVFTVRRDWPPHRYSAAVILVGDTYYLGEAMLPYLGF